MDDYLFWSTSELTKALQQKSLSSRELVEASLRQIETVNPEVNAIVTLCAERALEEATRADTVLANGENLGPLHGLPITIKDSLDTAGVVSTGGTVGRQHHIPTNDAPVVARLRDAGAILLGKTNTPELTLSGETDNLIYGRTNNPFHLERSPGGSSGGSAAAVATGMSALDIGSDTGGSIREPAHYCGIAGLKPTSGRTPRTGHIVPFGLGGVDSLTQVGPMARCVEDLALALPIICGPDYTDPSVVDMPLGAPADIDIKRLRIASYVDIEVTDVDAEIAAATEATVSALRADGLNIEQALPPGYAQAAKTLSDLRQADGGSIVRRLLERYGTSNSGPHMTYCFSGPPAVDGERYSAVLEQADRARSQLLGFLRDYDAIVCPVSRRLAPLHGDTLNDTFLMWSYCTVYNLTGWPGLSVPAASSKTGLPIGVQVIAAPWREDVALALGARIEALMQGYCRPPMAHST